MIILEVCVDTAAGLFACQGRADRVELCSALSVGGLTPTPGLVDLARASDVPVHAMIRPRTGDFEFDDHDIECCLHDISAVRQAGLAGVVLGATKGGALNLDALRQMSRAAGRLEMTLHRVIDILVDPEQAIEDAIALGFARILTSGGAPKAFDGLARLRQMQQVAKGRIEIMVGSGVTPDTVEMIAQATGITSFHASCSRGVPQDSAAQSLGFAGAARNITDADTLTALRLKLDGLANP